ncbi:GspE/PulE family protein [Sphingomonas sp. CJ20]
MDLDLDAGTAAAGQTAAQPRRREGPVGQGTLDMLLDVAFARGASHLHFEPTGKELVASVRAGGALAELVRLTREEARRVNDAVATRVGAGTGIAHDRGTIGFSGLVTRDGLRTVLRLPAAEAGDSTLAALGMRAPMVAALQGATARSGLILLAGTPGSGTTTTLRALLRGLAGGRRTMLSIEAVPGPRIAGVAQAALGASLSAGEALRQAIDHDIDVIGIDGIGDRETAGLAVEAAQAGLLVIATVAAADAVSAIRALREWRIGSFALASTLNAVVAQRLVRRLCPACRIPVQAQGSVSALLGFDTGAIVYSPVGCPACRGSGFAGDVAVFEAIQVDPAIRRLINDGGDESILARHAFVRAPNLGSAARALVREGVTVPEEAVRVSRG